MYRIFATTAISIQPWRWECPEASNSSDECESFACDCRRRMSEDVRRGVEASESVLMACGGGRFWEEG